MASDFPYLYPYSRAEAVRCGETQKHEDSFRENVKCARDIEKALREHGHDDSPALDEGCAQSILEAYGFKRVWFVLSNSLSEMALPREISEDVRQWARRPYVPSDGKRNRHFTVNASSPLLEAFIRQTREAYQALGLFGPEHCAGNPFKLDYEGKVLVLSPDALRESCWSPHDQLWLATGGAGCSPSKLGTTIFAVCLSDGEKTRLARGDFAGVLDEQYLPDWAAEKLAEIQNSQQQQPEASSGGMEMT